MSHSESGNQQNEDFVARIVAEHLADEREERRRLAREGIARKAAAGGISGKAPLGYVNRREGSRTWVELDPLTAPLIVSAFELLDEGMALRPALAKLSGMGLRTRSGEMLSVSTFQCIVGNPFYAGYVRNGKKHFHGNHTVLVTVETFWRVQGRLAQRDKRQRGKS